MKAVSIRRFESLRIRKTGFGIEFLLFFMILFDYHFFYLFDYRVGIIDTILRFGDKFITGVAGCFIAVCVYIFYAKKMRYYGSYITKYGFTVFIIFLLFAFYTIQSYPNQKLADTFRYGGRFLYPLYAIGFLYIFERDEGPSRWLSIINKLCFLWYLYIILQAFFYSVTGSLLFDFASYFSGDDVNVRDSGLRVGLGTFGNIMLIYNLIHALGASKQNISVFSIVQSILGIYCIIFVQQTRATILLMSLCIAFILFFRGGTTFQNILKPLFVLGIGILLFTSDVVWNFISSFSPTGEQSGSTIARLYAWEYYFNKFLANPLFGFAWPGDESYYNVAHGALGVAYLSDVGFVGLMAELGLFSIPFYIVPLARMGYILYKIGIRNAVKKYMFLVVLFLYLIGSSITLIITDAGRALAFPFIIALFEFYFNKFNAKNTNKRSTNEHNNTSCALV